VHPLEKARDVLESMGFNAQRVYTESIDGGDPATSRPAYTADTAPRYYWDGSALPATLGSNSPWVPYPDQLTNTLATAWNDGRIFVFYNSHGWCNAVGWWGVPFGNWDVDSLAADKPLPVVISTTCDSGFYDIELNETCDPGTPDPCFAEKLIRADKKGAVTVIAAPRETLIYVNGHLTEGYAHAIQWAGTGVVKMRLADMFLYGQGWVHGSCDPNDAVTHNRLYHIFGDPSLRIRLQKPPLTLSSIAHATLAFIGNLAAIDVSFATEGAVITAFQGSDRLVPVGRGVVSGGVAHLQMLTGRGSGVEVGTELELVATHPDALPANISATLEAAPRQAR
jgi:hypothetical protein